MKSTFTFGHYSANHVQKCGGICHLSTPADKLIYLYLIYKLVRLNSPTPYLLALVVKSIISQESQSI
jgi:hypothetical protein